MATSDPPVDLVIPHSGLTEVVVLVEWLVDDGDLVDHGTPLAVIESGKTQIELDSTTSPSVRRSAGSTGDVVTW